MQSPLECRGGFCPRAATSPRAAGVEHVSTRVVTTRRQTITTILAFEDVNSWIVRLWSRTLNDIVTIPESQYPYFVTGEQVIRLTETYVSRKFRCFRFAGALSRGTGPGCRLWSGRPFRVNFPGARSGGRAEGSPPGVPPDSPRGGKSELRKAGCRVTPGHREVTESAAESRPPMAPGTGHRQG